MLQPEFSHDSAPMPLVTDEQVAIHLHNLQTLLDDKKAIDLVTLDVRERSTVADFFLLCSGNSSTHTRALAETAQHYVKENDLMIYGLEGRQEGTWVLLDIGFIVVHVMQQSQREFYNLEQLWSYASKRPADSAQ
ncbi:MAG: ribosome silencing factor [Candidatus Sericytochromatia bacterium]